MAVTWRTNSQLPVEVREVLERAVNAKPPEWLVPPQDDEVFDDPDECERRLNAYSLAQGFDVVRTHSRHQTGPGITPFVTFQCIFHGSETRNFRQLEKSVTKDKDDKITSRRKRDSTAVRKTDCRWSCRVSYRSIGKRGTEPKAWILAVKSLHHSGHDLVDNPLIFTRHRQQTEEYRTAKREALAHRSSIIPYSVSRRILDSNDEYRLKLTAKEYYNLVRNQSLSGDDPKTIEGLLIALDNAGFIHRCRYDDVVDKQSGKVISRKIIQIWFTHQDLLDAAARFVAGSVCSIDATFNTNKVRMPIIIAVGVLNNDTTFPIAFTVGAQPRTTSHITSFGTHSLPIYLLIVAFLVSSSVTKQRLFYHLLPSVFRALVIKSVHDTLWRQCWRHFDGTAIRTPKFAVIRMTKQ